ncbi:MAG: amidohydrolase family protein [Spirochaetes bacterium]|nr:amidohydrolase family protein [Spirochaetota bacterium]
MRMLLRKGLIVDGSGGDPYTGDLLINGKTIEAVTERGIGFRGKTVDCTGKVIAPGFIDAHSHLDWILGFKGHQKLTDPFIAQGVTTLVTGNCGFGVAGFLTGSPYKELIETRVGSFIGRDSVPWDTMEDYFSVLRRQGISHNIVNLAGHGTSRMSIRGFNPAPMDPGEMRTLLRILDEAMEQGCCGVSFGLQYEPGIFATTEEMTQVARLVKKRDRILTVHLKAYSALSPTYPIVPFGTPHNLRALKEMLDIARETGVRLQISHLIFVGTKTWKTCGAALGMIDRALRDGVEVKFDTYAYHCGNSIINVVLPDWFLGRVPGVFDDRKALRRLKFEFMVIKKLLGFGYEDVQIIRADHPELDRFNGMFMGDIARMRKMDPFDNYIDFAKKSGGKAAVLNHRYTSLDNIKELMRHPASLFMTDALVSTKGVQNPAVYGNFPRFLQYAREFRNISLEEAVRKMTGAAAERFNLKGRGILKKGFAADITVFDWGRVRDNNTGEKTDAAPTGIEAVFINGKRVFDGKKTDRNLLAGAVL